MTGDVGEGCTFSSMRRRSSLGPDPLATITFAGAALVASAAFLGAASVDGSAIGLVDVLVALAPPAAVAGYLVWVRAEREPSDTAHRIAVAVLTAQADDPTLRGDDVLTRAAADLVAAIDDTERAGARERLLRIIAQG